MNQRILPALLAVCLASPVAGQSSPRPAVTDLFQASGPADADTVVIFAQGGPFTSLRTDLLDNLPGSEGKLHVYVHQPWTIDSTLLADVDGVPPARAEELNQTASDYLDQVARHFNRDGRTVFVVGHSYGALLTLSWLSQRDTDLPVRILAGRLAMPEVVWTAFRSGTLYWFPDAQHPVPLDNTPRSRLVPMRLQAGVGAPRYMSLLRGRDLSNVVFVYGNEDRLVGTLQSEEIEFLENHGATVIELHGGHRSMFEPEHAAVLEGILFPE